MSKQRWENLTREESELWASRGKLAAEKLGPTSGVADYGCGWMTLERFLAPDTQYVPIDLTIRDHRTIVCDFNTDGLPVTGVPAAACLGLVGYLDRPERFMRDLAQRHTRAVVSYKATDAPRPQINRAAALLVNAFSTAEFSTLVKASGWTVEDITVYEPVQLLWTLSRKDDEPATEPPR